MGPVLDVWLSMDRDRVVDLAADALFGKAVSNGVAVSWKSHRVLVPDVLTTLRHTRRQVPVELARQALRIPLALPRPPVELSQLGKAKGRSEIGRPEIRAQGFVFVADAHPMTSIQP